MTKSASELRIELNAACEKVNELTLENATNDRVEKAIAIAKDLASDYNAAKCKEVFAELRDKENPMYEAIMLLEVPCVNFKGVSDKDTDIKTYIVEDDTKLIDIAAFDRFCGAMSITPVAGWQYQAEHFARLLAARATKDMGGDYKELLNTWALSKKAKEWEMSNAVPCSNSQLTKDLQKFIDMIIFKPYSGDESLNEYKVTSQDVAFLLYTACKAGKKPKTVAMPRGNTIIRLATQIINRIMTGGTYESLYKRAEKEVGK